MINKRDHYEVLGVDKEISAADLKKAYRKLAMKYHPDRQQGKSETETKAAEEEFKTVQKAYEVLSDEQKRANYDQFGHAEPDRGFSPFNGVQEMMRQWAAEAQRQQMIVQLGMQLSVTLKEAFEGCTKTVNLNNVRLNETVKIEIPKGAWQNQQVAALTRKLPNGRELQLQVVVKIELPTSVEVIWQARPGAPRGGLYDLVQVPAHVMLAGGFFEYTTLDGATLQVRVPPGSDSNKFIKVPEKGYYFSPGEAKRGDLFFQLTPKITALGQLSTEELKFLQQEIESALANKNKLPEEN